MWGNTTDTDPIVGVGPWGPADPLLGLRLERYRLEVTHFLSYQEPDVFNDIVLGFIGEH